MGLLITAFVRQRNQVLYTLVIFRLNLFRLNSPKDAALRDASKISLLAYLLIASLEY